MFLGIRHFEIQPFSENKSRHFQHFQAKSGTFRHFQGHDFAWSAMISHDSAWSVWGSRTKKHEHRRQEKQRFSGQLAARNTRLSHRSADYEHGKLLQPIQQSLDSFLLDTQQAFAFPKGVSLFISVPMPADSRCEKHWYSFWNRAWNSRCKTVKKRRWETFMQLNRA